MKNKWFKHYNTAHDGLTLKTLWCDGEFEAYSLFWLLLELISRFESENDRGKLTISMNVLRRETGWNLQRLTRVLLKIGQTSSEVDGIRVLINLDQTCELFVPKWLELQETRGGKNNSKTFQKADRSKKKEVRSKNTPIVPISKNEEHTTKINLELAYQIYPKKIGKTKGLQKLSTIIKDEVAYEKFLKAVKNYSKIREGEEPKFTKNFDTFVNCFEDYVDDSVLTHASDNKIKTVYETW